MATRAIALTLDLLLGAALFALVSGFVALISSLVGTLRPAWLVGTQTFPIAGVISISIMLIGTAITWFLFR